MKRTTCRLCDSSNLELVMPLEPTPLEDEFLTTIKEQPLYSLDTYLCKDCGHLQNLDVVDASLIFNQYTYRTSVNSGLVKHFKEYAKVIFERFKPSGLIVDIGSNDGTLLKEFKAKGLRVLGIDAAEDIAKKANDSGLNTLHGFFTEHTAKIIKNDYGQASIICANNVFAHADDLHTIAEGVKCLLASGGVFIFEVSWLAEVIRNFAFDTINHDHLSHHSIMALMPFLNRHGLELFDAEEIQNKGGSIRCYAQHKNGIHPETIRLERLRTREYLNELDKPETYRDYFGRIRAKRMALGNWLNDQIIIGKSIYGYGASCTSTALTYQLGIEKLLSGIFDDNPLKHGTHSPGAHIPVYPSEEIRTKEPDIIVVLSWLYVDQIKARHLNFKGQWIHPLEFK